MITGRNAGPQAKNYQFYCLLGLSNRLNLTWLLIFNLLRGKGGVPGGQIMENEFEYLTDRGGYGDHLAEKFLKKYCS